ncbi:MAG: hypothetical protein ACODAE_02695 [Gemmatimonadota bacterium]
MAQQVSKTVDWRAAVLAGLIAGAVFLVLEMIMVPLFLDGSPWAPPRMIAAIAMGREVLPPPATFEAGIFITAMIVHFALSIIYGIVLAWLIFRLNRTAALLVGAAFGLAIYLVNFYGFTAVFPWFADARNWVSVVAHIAFGLVAAWAYVALAARGAVAGEVGRGGRMAAD